MADEARSGSQDSTAVDRDLLLGRSLIERGVLTSETLHRCLRYQEEQRKLGRAVPLARILVTHGGVDKDVILALRPAEPGALPCPLCRTSLKVEGQVPGKPFRCPSCKAILTMAPDRTSLEVQTRDWRAKGCCPACRKEIPPSQREAGESFPCPFCGSTVRAGPDGHSLVLVEKVLAEPADSNRETAVDPMLPAAGARRAGSTRAAAKSSSGVGSASGRPPGARRPTSSVSPPPAGARGGSSGSGSASRSTASNVPSTDREDFERRDREYERLLLKKGLLTEAEVEICRTDGEGDRVRGSFLPIVHYAVKRNYLQPSQLKEILTEFRTASASSGAGGVGEKEPTLVDRLDKGSSPLGRRQGECFAGHEILDELGRGGMGAVYRARDLVTGQVVALKVLLGGDEASRIHVKRFQREVDLVKALGHRNIVAIHKFGIEEGYHYFTMDFVDGPTLKDALKNRAMGAKRAVQVFIRILSALDHAHRKGIVHRDLKPSNVILDRDGEPLLTDFGLAKRIDSESQLTKTESAVGTPHYMSPEQVSGGRIRITAQTDLYAVGVMLYQVVAGRLPFRADNQAQLYNQILHEEAEPPSTHNPAVDKSMDTICLKAIAKHSEDRYPTAREFADDLKRYLAGEPIRARPQSKMSRTWRKVKSNPRTTLALSLAVAIAVASVGIAFLLSRSDTGGPGVTPAEIARREAEVELERGLRFLESGKAANAAEAFQRALALDPTFTEASLGLARSLAALGDFSGASSILEGVLKEKAGDRDALLLLGRIALDEGAAQRGKGEEGAASECYQRAVRHFTDSIRLYPDDPEGYKGRGDAYQELGLRDEMIGDRTEEERCRKLQVGNVLLEAGELLGAGKLIEALARIEPYAGSLRDNLEVQLLYGRILEAKGSLGKALGAYSICVAKEPNDSSYRVRRARVLVELGRYQGAEEDLASAKVDAKAGDEAVYLRGRVAEGKGFLAEALPFYDAALVGTYLSEGQEASALDRIVDLRFRRGRARFRLDDFRGAASDLDQVLERRPDLVEARFFHGASLVETGEKLRTAQADLEAAVAGGYQPVYQVDIYQGRLSLLAGKPEEALDRFRRVAEAMPALPDAFYHRAQAYLALGRGTEAHADAAEAVRLDPFRARHFKMLGQALMAQEDYERAEDAFLKALELDINDFENIIGVFRALVGQGEFSKVMDLESLVSLAITSSWAISIDLFEAEPEEVRRLYLEDERRAGAADESRVEDHFWAVAHADPTVREAGVQGLVEAGPPLLD
ncbi:MAG: protein kinase, partial [Planctomycetes bacterium]|nr:protein kinase [Planctomycetota bacterium]